MLHLAEETKLFDFLSSVNFHLISAQVVFLSVSNLISSNGFRRSVYSYSHSFPLKFSYQNVDYMKNWLTSKYKQGNVQMRRSLGKMTYRKH